MSRASGRALSIAVKWIAIAAAGSLIIAAAAIAALLFWLDPNIFRDDLEDLARKQGVALHLGGELGWRLYPQLQIITTDIALGAPDATLLAELDSLAVSVALGPLLRSELQVTGVTATGLRARFEVDEDGSNNWQTLIKQGDASPPKPTITAPDPQTAGEASPPITIDKLRLVNGQLHYINRQTAQTASANNISVVVENLGSGPAPSTLSLQAKITASDPTQALNSQVAFASSFTLGDNLSAIDLQQARFDAELHYRAGDREVDSQIHLPFALAVTIGEQFAVNTLTIDQGQVSYHDNRGNRVAASDLRVAGRFRPDAADTWQLASQLAATLAPDADGQTRSVDTAVEASATLMFVDDAGTLTVSKLRTQLFAESSPLQITGDAGIQLDPLSVQGQVAIADFNPDSLATALSLAMPQRADTTALSRASLRGRFSTSADALRVTEFTARLDDTTATGEFVLPLDDAKRQPIELQLQLDQLNLDRYLPPADARSGSNDTSSAAPGGDADWDLSALSGLTLKADLTADRLSYRQIPLSEIHLNAEVQRGEVAISPLRGQVYASPFRLTAHLDTRSTPYQLRTEGQASKLPLGKLLADLQREQRFSGNSDISFQLTSRGNNIAAVQRALNGDIAVTGRDLTLQGINIERAFCRLVTAVQQQSFNPAEWADITHFADATTRIRFKDGVARIDKLNAGVSQLAVSATGKVDLGQALFDVVFNTRLASRDREQAPCAIDNPKLLDRDIPIRCQASFGGIDASTCLPDMRVAEDIAKEKIKDKIDDKAKSLLKEKLGEEKSRAAEQLFKQLIKPSSPKAPSDSKGTDKAPATASPADNDAAAPTSAENPP